MKLQLFNKCPKCGQNNNKNSRYCSNCGYEILKDKTKANAIRKCPFCGQIISKNDLKCPSCRNEIPTDINNVNSELSRFRDSLSEYDILIEAGGKPSSGYRSWSIGAKLGWILLNMCTLCIALSIYMVIKNINLSGDKYLTAPEKQKISFIRNYSFNCNAQEAMALMNIIKANLESLLNDDKTSNYAFALAWKTKAKQLKDSFEINDKNFENVYYECMDLARRINSKKAKKLIISVVVCIALITFVVVYGYFYKKNGG